MELLQLGCMLSHKEDCTFQLHSFIDSEKSKWYTVVRSNSFLFSPLTFKDRSCSLNTLTDMHQLVINGYFPDSYFEQSAENAVADAVNTQRNSFFRNRDEEMFTKFTFLTLVSPIISNDVYAMYDRICTKFNGETAHVNRVLKIEDAPLVIDEHGDIENFEDVVEEINKVIVMSKIGFIK